MLQRATVPSRPSRPPAVPLRQASQRDLTKAFFLIADISGFTRYMVDHPVSTSHAERIMARLLNALVDEAKAPLQLVEVEGDALFFYAPASDAGLATVARALRPQLRALLDRFGQEIHALSEADREACEPCGGVEQLKLKLILHVGDAVIQPVDRFEKLFGLDVIVVHRLLKNSVASGEYVMMTEAAHEAMGRFEAGGGEQRKEQVDGIGEVAVRVFYPGTPPSLPAAQSGVRPWSRWWLAAATALGSVFVPSSRDPLEGCRFFC